MDFALRKKLLHTGTGVCPFPDCGKNVEITDVDSPEVTNRRDSQSSTSSVVGRMEINTTETIPEEPNQEMNVENVVDGEEEVATQSDASSKKWANL